MYRESSFEANIKWFVVGFAGLSALCQLIMLFSEFTFFSAVGILFNGLYHFAGFLAPGLIVFLLLKRIDNKEIYSSYSIGLFSLLGAITNICLLVKYIMNTNGTEGLKVWLIIILSILILLEILYSVVFVKFGLDKVTSFLVILLTIIVVIFKGCVYSSVDSKLQTYAYNTVEKSIFSVWTFMFLLFFIAMIVSLMLYLDSGFLLDVVQNPQNLFTKNTLFGTYTNLYMQDEKKSNKQVSRENISNVNNLNESIENDTNIKSGVLNTNIIIENNSVPTPEVQQQFVKNVSIGENGTQNSVTTNISDDVMEVNNYPSNNISTDKKEGMTEMEKENNKDVNSITTGKNNSKLIIGLVAVVAILLVVCAVGIGIIIGRGNNTEKVSSSAEETSTIQENKEETTETTTEEKPITQAEAGVIYAMQQLRNNLKNPHSLKVYSIHYYVYDTTNDLFVAIEYEATNNVGGTVEDWLYYDVDGDLFSSDEKEVAAAKLVGCKSVNKSDYNKHSENEIEVDVDRIMDHIDDYEF